MKSLRVLRVCLCNSLEKNMGIGFIPMNNSIRTEKPKLKINLRFSHVRQYFS